MRIEASKKGGHGRHSGIGMTSREESKEKHGRPELSIFGRFFPKIYMVPEVMRPPYRISGRDDSR
jgi:hypothetical protein